MSDNSDYLDSELEGQDDEDISKDLLCDEEDIEEGKQQGGDVQEKMEDDDRSAAEPQVKKQFQQKFKTQEPFTKVRPKEEDDDMERRALKMQDQPYDIRKFDLSKQQHQLIKDIAADLIGQFDIPQTCLILPQIQDKVRKMMITRDHKVAFDKVSRDGDLMNYLNNCKEDLYKQLFFNYREFFQTNLHRRWTRAIIKQISQQIIEDKEQYSKIQVKKGKVPKEFLWYHATIHLTAKLMKESDEGWLDFQLRSQLKVHHMKLIALILQIESSEFADIFKQAFE